MKAPKDVLVCSWFMEWTEWTKMNEDFKLFKSAQNDLESVRIGPRSVPAKF